MIFRKKIVHYIELFESDCGEYQAVNYDGVRLYKKDTFWDAKTRKKYRAFGNAVERESGTIHSKKYSSYREAFKAAEKHKRSLYA